MGAYVFNNQPFDTWLNKKSEEILSKVDRERITTEEMIILVLKAQTNHFYHADIDLKKGLGEVDRKIESTSSHLNEKIKSIDHKIETTTSNLEDKIDRISSHLEEKIKNLDHKIDTSTKHLDEKFNFLDNKIDVTNTRLSSLERRFDLLDQKIDSRFMWMIGITIAMSGGIYLKLFLG